MATNWKPLELTGVEHIKYNPSPPRPHPTPLQMNITSRVPKQYYNRSNEGLHYALYTLAHLSRDDISDILQTIKFHTDDMKETHAPKIARAPIYDFCNGKTLGDIYAYHTSLLDDGNHGIAYGRFIVAAHADWEAQGLLVVDCDCRPDEPGMLGIMRTTVEMLPYCLVLLGRSNRHWTELKADELRMEFPAPIPGYTGSTWQTCGYRPHENKE